jgi:iron complex outermembrane receptor protein
LALIAGVGIPFLMAASAFGQAANPAASPATGLPEAGPGPAAPPAPQAAGEASTERVVVTGSYIPTAEEVTASPLDTLTTQEVARAGTSDVLTVLTKRNPDFVGAGNIGSTNANISSGTTLGGAIVALRGLPTLVLFNGRRIAPSAAIAAGGAAFADVNLFPTALISRIEVLKDGASATYGSEAVGGVVNIFLKEDFQGVEIGARYGFSVEPGVAERRAHVIAGVGNETTHVTMGIQYYEIDPLFQRERHYSSIPGTQGATTTFGGAGRDSGGFYLLNGVDPAIGLPNGQNSPFDSGVVPGGAFNYAAIANGPGLPYNSTPQSVITGFNLSTQPTSTLDIANTNAYTAFSHQIFGKQLEFFGDFLYTRNHSSSYLNAQPLSNGTGVIVPAGRVGTIDDVNDPGYIAGVTNTIYNPFNRQIDGSTLGAGPNRLFALNRYQTNPRIFTNDSNFYRILGGLRSQITEDWMAEAATYYSHYTIDYVNRNLVNADQLNAMIAGTAVDNNGNPIPAFDFFAQNPVGTNPGQVSQEQFATIFGNNIRKLDSFQETFDAKIVGFPFSIPGGKVGISVGGEYREEGFKVNDSPEIFVGSVPIQEINATRSIYSFYGEMSIPIVSSSMKVPGIYSLELSLAGRYDHYEGVDEDAKVPKITLRYQPIKDLTLRATYSNSFVAPTLYELFGPAGQGFSDQIDFGTGAPYTEDQAQVRSGSNPNLIPSTAEAYTAGIVYSPSYLQGLTITIDYFRTLQQDIVSALGGATILGSVNEFGPASPYSDFVAIGNFPGQPGSRPVNAGDLGPFGYLSGNLASVFYIDTLQNIGAARVEGFDTSARYNIDLHAAGQLELGVNAVVFTKNDLKRTPFSNYYNISGLVGSEFTTAGNPDYKMTFLAEYRFAGFNLSLNATYIPELFNAVGQDPEGIDTTTLDVVEDYLTVDGRLSYTFKGHTTAAAAVDTKDAKSMVDSKGGAASVAGAETMSPMQKLLDGLTLTVGCNNMFDEEPPQVIGANSATNLSLYDPYGRFVYFEVTKKF